LLKKEEVAEGMGFEPTIRHYPYNGLAIPRHAPSDMTEIGKNLSKYAGFSVGENGEHQVLSRGLRRRTTRHSRGWRTLGVPFEEYDVAAKSWSIAHPDLFSEAA